MDFLNSWLQGIIVAVIIATIIEMVLPNGNSKKYIKMVLGVYIVFNIIAPIINKFSKNTFEINSLINLEKYEKSLETYKTKNDDLEKSNESSIKQIYVSKLESDMKAKLEEKGYQVEYIKIQIEDTEEYKIKQVNIFIKEKEEKNEEKEQETDENNKIEVKVNKIEEININLQNDKSNENKTNENSNNSISKTKEKEIKKYISSVYEIKENLIIIN